MNELEELEKILNKVDTRINCNNYYKAQAILAAGYIKGNNRAIYQRAIIEERTRCLGIVEKLKAKEYSRGLWSDEYVANFDQAIKEINGEVKE